MDMAIEALTNLGFDFRGGQVCLEADSKIATMVIVSPQDLGLWNPFQMAELHGLRKWRWS